MRSWVGCGRKSCGDETSPGLAPQSYSGGEAAAPLARPGAALTRRTASALHLATPPPLRPVGPL